MRDKMEIKRVTAAQGKKSGDWSEILAGHKADIWGSTKDLGYSLCEASIGPAVMF